MSFLLPSLCALSLALGEVASATGERIRIDVVGPNEHLGGLLAEQALAPAEAAVRRVDAWLSGPSEVEERLAIQVYRRPGRFRGLFRRGVAPTEGPEQQRAEERGAFLEPGARVACVDLQPRYGEDALKDVGLPSATLRRVAEFATRSTLLEAVPELPEGVLAGLSGAVAQEVLVGLGQSAPALADPGRSSWATLLQERLEDGTLPSAEALVLGDPEALPPLELDAARVLLFEYLGAERWPVALVAAREGGREALGPVLLGPDPTSLDAAFRVWLAGLEPPWSDPDGRTAGPPDRVVQAGLEKAEVACWQREPIESEAYSITGELVALPGGRCHFNVLFAGDGDSHLLINISRDGETYAYAQSGRDWEELQYATTPRLAPGHATPFEVRVGDDRAEVRFGGALVFSLALGGHPVRGRWGIGTPAQSACVWRDVAVAPR